MKGLIFIRDFLLLLFVVYYAQGSLYGQGSILSQAALALILGISCFYLIKSLLLKNKASFFFSVWTALLLLNVFGFIFTADHFNSYHFSMFKGIIISSLPFFPFYYFSRKNILKSEDLIRFFIIMLPITIFQFFYNQNKILSDRFLSTEDLVNNMAYSFVGLIPFVFLFKQKKIYSIASMIILIFFIIQGAKRGALIAGTIGLIFFLYFQFRMIDRKNWVKSFFLMLIGVAVLSYFTYDLYQSNEYLISRMQRIGEEGGSSGRDVIFENIFVEWYNSNNIFRLLFGFGFAASLELSGTGRFAHNDWLELLSNFGLLGVTLYGLLFYSALREMKVRKWRIDRKMVMITVLFIWFFITLVSMSYTSQNGYTQAILLGYLIGNKNNRLV